jgi:hypothetical protein
MKNLHEKAWKVEIHQPSAAQPMPKMTSLNGTLESSKHSDKDKMNFVHTSLGFPAPTTFMNAARKGFINGTNQYIRLTSKLVAKHMPDAMATARGHLERKPASQPHSAFQSVSALRRFHADQHVITKSSTPFDPTTATQSQTLHMDYTERLSVRPEHNTSKLRVGVTTSTSNHSRV